MSKQDEVCIINNEFLSSFCELKLKDYTNSIKSALLTQDLTRLKEVLTSLSEESETIGAFHISTLSREISKKIDLFEPENEKNNKRVMRILSILENLEKDSKDYTNTLLYTKKIDIIDTYRSTKIIQLAEETFDDLDIEKEFRDQWKCCIY
jgi:hypothetical protein